MRDPFREALSALSTSCFEAFSEALERYLVVAGEFWRQVRDLGEALTDPAAAEVEPEVVRGLLGDLLLNWEDVSAMWARLVGAGAAASAQLPPALESALARHLTLLRAEFDQQAAGLAGLVDLIAALGDGLGPLRAVAEA